MARRSVLTLRVPIAGQHAGQRRRGAELFEPEGRDTAAVYEP